jgi:hypothetical protein
MLGCGGIAVVAFLALRPSPATEKTDPVPAIVSADPGEPEAEDAEGEFTSVGGGSDAPIKLGDKDSSRRFVEAGGTEQSEEAVALGLKWLAAQQLEDGRWTAQPPRQRGPKGAVLPQGRWQDIAATGFGLLPFLARGETHLATEDVHQYTKNVELGIKFLIAAQKPDGDLRGDGTMYVHAIASIALCEDFNMTSDPLLREPCQKAIDFIVKAQNKRGGGWRYRPGEAGDLSVTAWVIQALKSGQMAGITPPRETLENASKYLKSVSLPNESGYGYMPRNGGSWEPIPATMTAAGLLSEAYLQGSHDTKASTGSKAIERILAAPPSPQLRNMYYYYYATFALFNRGGEPWQNWNTPMRELLVNSQSRGHDLTLKGSWEPQMKNFPGYGGRLLTTSLALLTLEVYYRHLPLNRPDLGDVAKELAPKKPKK